MKTLVQQCSTHEVPKPNHGHMKYGNMNYNEIIALPWPKVQIAFFFEITSHVRFLQSGN